MGRPGNKRRDQLHQAAGQLSPAASVVQFQPRDNRQATDEEQERREAIRQLAELRRRLAAAKNALAEAHAAGLHP